MIKELIILAQVAVQSPPNIMDSNQVPVYSWEKPRQPPRYQVPFTGIFMQSGSGRRISEDEELLFQTDK